MAKAAKGTPEAPWLVPVPPGDIIIEAVADAQEPRVTTKFHEHATVIRIQCGVAIRIVPQEET